ncbi:16541_t:CDS:2, partial [Racocetra persica]
GNDKFLSRTILYRANDDEDVFRELTYKDFTGNTKTLVIDFKKNSILCLIQTIPISSPHPDFQCTPEDLPYAFSLLLFTTLAITNSYKINTSIGRQSFMLSKKLYNPVTSQKGIESDVIVSYTNPNRHYNSLKDSLKKSVVSAVGRLKLNLTKKSAKEFNSHLDIIKEQYATINSQTSNKKRKVTLFSSVSKSSSDKAPATDLMELINQI